MKKIKVIIAGKTPPPYMGPAIATEIILNSSLRETFDLIHLDTKANTSLTTLGKWSLRKALRNLQIWHQLLRIGIRERPRVMLLPISQTTLGFLKDSVLLWLARLTGCRVVIHLRGSAFKTWIRNATPLTRYYVGRCLAKAYGVIVLGEKLRHLFEDFFDQDRIFVVPNGGNYDLPQANQPADGALRILYLGNFQASKGISDVIKALAIVRREYRGRFQADFVGQWRDHTTRVECETIIHDEKLPVQIHPPANLNQKLNWLAQADIFVFVPREPEGHPWVIVEALAAGLPVVSSDRGAISESVIDGLNGFLVTPNQPAMIAGCLLKLMVDEELRKDMGRKSRQRYLEHFTEEKMISRLAEVLQQAAR